MHFERQMVDTGEPDKRLLVVESEFGGVLQQTGREGNILSSVLRQAWDGKPLRILARSNKDNCQEPHIALIGNVTVEELKRLLTTNDRGQWLWQPYSMVLRAPVEAVVARRPPAR